MKNKNPANSKYNQRAQIEFKKMLSKFTEENGVPTAEQEVKLYSQAFVKQLHKNPSATRFPNIDECAVTMSNGTYVVSGYSDSTNSYGAQVRGDYTHTFVKQDGMWVCTDKLIDYSAWVKYFIIFAIVGSIISCLFSYCSYLLY